MSWHAVDALDDAVDATRRFLFPFGLVRWAKLALLVLLMGGGGAGVNAPLLAGRGAGVTPPQGADSGFGGVDSPFGGVDSPFGGVDSPFGGVDSPFGGVDSGSMAPGDVAGVVDPGPLAVVAVSVVLLIVAASVASLSLRLVFYDALRTNELRIWRPFLARLRQSLGLFLFAAVLSVAAAAPVAIGVLVAVAADTPVGWGPIDAVAGTLGSLSVGFLVALGLIGGALVAGAALALRFTYEFVVPTMIVEDTGIIGGWRRFGATARTEWTELLVYLVVHVVVALGLSVVEGVAVVFVFALVATVAGLVLLLVAVALGGLGALAGTAVGTVAVALVALAGVAVLLALVLPVQVVTRSYRIAYEVSTLGEIDSELALLHADIDPGSPDFDGPHGSAISAVDSGEPDDSGDASESGDSADSDDSGEFSDR
ncbi:DUF7544 domain-containing protein [Halorubrum yunnanense]|uniref:Membrane domain of glycerophosphoryl diester phosphodiesterase n=1 Tax=Halorubrum yunnanense TaxID=1526162 RepID=A0ABD5YJM0_9EURY|nr:hypothetical protein [Halorubrum yunnanense]